MGKFYEFLLIFLSFFLSLYFAMVLNSFSILNYQFWWNFSELLIGFSEVVSWQITILIIIFLFKKQLQSLVVFLANLRELRLGSGNVSATFGAKQQNVDMDDSEQIELLMENLPDVYKTPNNVSDSEIGLFAELRDQLKSTLLDSYKRDIPLLTEIGILTPNYDEWLQLKISELSLSFGASAYIETYSAVK